jgi:Phytanoyl-CoA dioxygenase (PhyH)
MAGDVSKFEADGFAIIAGVLSPAECDAIAAQAALPISGAAGSRALLSTPWCEALANSVRNNSAVRRLLPEMPVAVQCTYFEKSESRNWLVAMHQDLSIAVQERIDEAACSAWSAKEGMLFVQPPVKVLEGVVAVRVHLDDSNVSNGPLRVVPGSHQRGRLAPPQIQSERERTREITCSVPRGGALVMRPLLLHASSKAEVSAPRRVLHFVFGSPTLPLGLAWGTAV